MTNWKPDVEQLAWTRMFIRITNDGAAWRAPSMGVFRVDQKEKKLRFVERAPTYDHELYERTQVAFGKLGWEVVDEMEQATREIDAPNT